jgi:hypothetical protein
MATAPTPDEVPAPDALWLTDTDLHALEARVVAAVRGLGAGCTVTRFTYWYTGRHAVHEANVVRIVPHDDAAAA